MAQNITLMGASYTDVPAVTLPKTGGGTATFTDVTDTTAVASNVASTKYFYTANGVKTQGTATQATATVSSLQHGNNLLTLTDGFPVSLAPSWDLLYSTEVTASTSSTSASLIDTITVASAINTPKMIWLSIRDKAGQRTGYYYGSDVMYLGNKTYVNLFSLTIYYVTNSGFTYTHQTSGGAYGLYTNSVDSDGKMNILAKYNSNLGTLSGTFTVTLYSLDWPFGQTPYV